MSLANFYYNVPQAERQLSQKGLEYLYDYRLEYSLVKTRLRKLFKADEFDVVIDEVFK